MLSCGLRCTLQPSATGTSTLSKRCQLFRERGLPCGLHDSLCTLHLFCSPPKVFRDSATGATRDTGGGLILTRQGLPPCKMHQASLGALTPRVRGGMTFAVPYKRRLCKILFMFFIKNGQFFPNLFITTESISPFPYFKSLTIVIVMDIICTFVAL